MFGFFRKRRRLATLMKKHQGLLREAYKLSRTDRKASDMKHAEAAKLMEQIDALTKETLRVSAR